MSVGVHGHPDVIVSQSLLDHQRLDALMDEIGYMTVSEIVDPDLLKSVLLDHFFQLMLYRFLNDGEQPVSRLEVVDPSHILFQFICQKLRNVDRPN